jgi:hypothetical protein
MARINDAFDNYVAPTSYLPEDSAVKNAAAAAAASTNATAQAAEDAYYTQIVSGGKTQAQLDALTNARTTATTIRDASTTMSSRVDPITGQVITTPKGTILPVNPTKPVNPVNPAGVTTYTATDGKTFTDAQAYATYQASLNKTASDKALLDAQTKAAAETAQANRQSAYDLLLQQFSQYGLSALVTPLKDLITSNVSPSEFALRLTETDAYKKRFAANQARINQGLRALSPAEYIGLEDQYQNIMRNYGLPKDYYTKDSMGTQQGFEKFIGNDVSAAELEDRIMTAQSRVINSNPEVLASLKSFYPDITNGDILAYTLDPTKALTDIKRKVTAAEIGGAAMQSGLGITGARAGELGSAGITKAQAQQGFETIGGGLQRGSQLASIYGENPYTQTTAEQEVFGLSGKLDAKQQRQKITGLEKATFSGQTGVTSGALARDRAGAY